ncbi:hypothetical protein M0R45_006845 [Rubus argutus]|uniref:Uncharacterized protein n=1 Tax=Rubus argutus TaxID=59490 RepID=A0AAW1YS47_RUBAR
MRRCSGAALETTVVITGRLGNGSTGSSGCGLAASGCLWICLQGWCLEQASEEAAMVWILIVAMVCDELVVGEAMAEVIFDGGQRLRVVTGKMVR